MLIFGALPAMAAQVNSLVGQKVTSEVVVVVDGNELKDKGAVVDGRTNAPVRAIVEAIGGNIKLNGNTVIVSTVRNNQPIYLGTTKQDLTNIEKEIVKKKGSIKYYEEKFIPGDERAVEAAISEKSKKEFIERLELHKQELETFKTELADLQKQLNNVELKILEKNK